MLRLLLRSIRPGSGMFAVSFGVIQMTKRNVRSAGRMIRPGSGMIQTWMGM